MRRELWRPFHRGSASHQSKRGEEEEGGAGGGGGGRGLGGWQARAASPPSSQLMGQWGLLLCGKLRRFFFSPPLCVCVCVRHPFGGQSASLGLSNLGSGVS